MDIFTKLNELSLSSENSVVIGSGVLNALGIRSSNDVDVIVPQNVYAELERTSRFEKDQSYGREILTDELLEIGTSWEVLGKDQTFDDLAQNSLIIDGIRYITLDFLLAVKRSWLKGDDIRQKDIDDVKLVQKYLVAQSPK